MNQSGFLASLESELQLRGVPFDLAALQEFVADAWPLIADDPDVQKWADAFTETYAAGPASTFDGSATPIKRATMATRQ